MTAGLLVAMCGAGASAVALATRATGASVVEACWAVGAGLGWGGLTFAVGVWMAARRRERVGAEVAVVLAPVLRELRHVRGALAERGTVDESAKTRIHPRRVAPPSDEARTRVWSLEEAREAVR